LKARWSVTAEGDRGWTGWHDSELQEDCDFVETEEGVWRCVPTAIESARYRYLDAQCTDPVIAIADEQCGPPDRVRLIRQSGCSEYTELRSVGEDLSPPTVVYALDLSSGLCLADSVDGWSFFAVGDVLPMSQYVVAEERSVGTARLTTQVLVSSDGAYTATGWHDSRLDASCWSTRAIDGLDRCLPASLNRTGYFAEDQCTVELYAGDRCDDVPARFALQDASECPYAWRVHAALGEHQGAAYLSASPEDCREATGREPPPLVLRGDEIPPERFVALETTIDRSDPGRLKPRHRTSEDGFCAFLGWWDADFDEPCTFRRVADGTLRCLPGKCSGTVPRLYTDERCTEAVVYVRAAECDESAYAISTDYKDCEPIAEVFRISGPIPGSELPPLWRKLSDGSCEQHIADPSADYADYGSPLDPGQFVQAVEEVG
jgi:hypothetical protein